MDQNYFNEMQVRLVHAYREFGNALHEKGISPKPLEQLFSLQVEILKDSITEIQSLRDEISRLNGNS